MNRTVVFAGFLSLVATVAAAQPNFLTKATDETPELSFSFLAGSSEAAATDSPVHLNLPALSQAITFSFSVTAPNTISIWQERTSTPQARKSNVDWVGLLSEQVRIDAMMHIKRLTEPKTLDEITHSSYFGGYVTAVKGYFTSGWRWGDGDPFFGNNINHPIMGAVSSRVYTNNDRRCQTVGYGDSNYWSCVRRATVFSVLASVNWEWNPLLSESALGHVGKFYTCANGKCAGEGGWSDFVMTPMGGMGIRIAGDIARAKLWPKLDKHLSGNVAARILKVAVKVMTDPQRHGQRRSQPELQGRAVRPPLPGPAVVGTRTTATTPMAGLADGQPRGVSRVTPAEAGIQEGVSGWTPACAGVTRPSFPRKRESRSPLPIGRPAQVLLERVEPGERAVAPEEGEHVEQAGAHGLSGHGHARRVDERRRP